MEAFERWAFTRFRNVTVVSDDEAGIAKQWGAANVWIVKNGVDLNYFTVVTNDDEKDGTLLFLGSLDWFPNQDGLEWFVKNVLPAMRSLEAGAVMRVVGRNASPQFARFLQSTGGIEFVGEVADVRDELRRAAVVMVPLRIGGGSRIKILEALAW